MKSDTERNMTPHDRQVVTKLKVKQNFNFTHLTSFFRDAASQKSAFNMKQWAKLNK